MKIEFFKSKSDSKKIILVFLGYSFLPECLSSLKKTICGKECDLCVVYDYSRLDFVNLYEIIKNKEIYLIAWSMGVWAVNLVFSDDKFKDLNLVQKIAINGTIYGIDEERGIPKDVFKKSIDEFDFDNFKRLCFLKDISRVNFDFNPNSKFELEQIYKFSQQNNKIIDIVNFDKTIISKKDFIFPIKAYENLTCKKEFINAPHFPFFCFESLGDIFEV